MHVCLCVCASVHARMNIYVCMCVCFDVCSYSFIRSGYFYSVSSSPLVLLRGAPDTERILCLSFMPKRHRQLQVKNVPKVPRPLGRKTSNLPMSHHAPHLYIIFMHVYNNTVYVCVYMYISMYVYNYLCVYVCMCVRLLSMGVCM